MTAQFQDITPPRRSIRDIPLKGERVLPTFSPPTPSSFSDTPPSPPPPPPLPPPPIYFDESPRPKRRFGWAIATIVIVLIILFGVSFFFASATVKITPKIIATNVNQTFSADQKSTGDNVLPYALITLEKEGSTEVPATGEGPVSEKASGQIIIYNNYSTEPQDLIATTRFQTPEGLVYRIDKNIVIPGKTAAGPGSVEATIYADQPGEKYNTGLKDFTVPGFQGTPKYQGFYARSKTALAGGFVGNRKQASADDLAKAHTKIEGELGRGILEQVGGQKPDNFVLFDGAILSRFSALANGSSTSKTVIVREKVTAEAIVFDREVISTYLLRTLGVDETITSIENLESLSFNLLNKDAFLTGSSTVINFSLKGPLKLVSKIDSSKLSAELAGTKRGGLNAVLSTYPAVDKAQVVFKPPWLFSFPKEAAKIKIEVLDE